MSTATMIQALSTFSNRAWREAQEDHVLVMRDRGILVLADGFGGPVSGTEVAKTSCESVLNFLEKEAGDLDATLPFVLRSYFSLAGNVLFNALIHANRKVRAFNREKSVNEKGGASVIAGYLDGDLMALASVGACSAWLIRGSKATRLATARTYSALVDPFVESQGVRVPLMALGMSEDLEPEIMEFRVQPGDWVIFQSEGLTSSMRDRIARLQDLGLQADGAVRAVTELLQGEQFPEKASVALAVF